MSYPVLPIIVTSCPVLPIIVYVQIVPILVEPIAGEEYRGFVGRIIRKITKEMPIFAVQNFRFPRHLREEERERYEEKRETKGKEREEQKGERKRRTKRR